MSEPSATRATVTGDGGDAKYVQRIRTGRHALLADAPAEEGGKDAGPSPTEYVMSGLGACTAMTLRMYAERKGWVLGTVTVNLELRQENGGRRIERSVSISAALDESQRARLAEICEKTPVTLLLKRGIEISTSLKSTPPELNP